MGSGVTGCSLQQLAWYQLPGDYMKISVPYHHFSSIAWKLMLLNRGLLYIQSLQWPHIEYEFMSHEFLWISNLYELINVHMIWWWIHDHINSCDLSHELNKEVIATPKPQALEKKIGSKQ